MKNIKIVITTLLFTIGSIAQNGINYKALVKDSDGNPIENQTIDLRIKIQFDGGGSGIVSLYEENHTTTSDENGIVVLEIGMGTPIVGDFSSLAWERAQLLNVEVDIERDGTYVDFGLTPINDVPRAIHASRAEVADIAENVSGLEAIDEGNGQGWRLLGSNSNNYGNIGFRSTDLSYSDLESTTYGATGPNSTAMGIRTSANGDSSLALGSDSTASDDFSVAIGAGAVAANQQAVSIGGSTQASGFASTALGFFTEASGTYTAALGQGTRAQAQNATAIGRYNLGYGNLNSWVDFDPLFEVGNGTDSSNRNNALTVFKNGFHLIDSESVGVSISSGIGNNDDGIRVTGSGGDGVVVFSAGQDGVRVSSADENGGFFRGEVSGVHAESNNDINPDLILGGRFNTASGDDGIIASDPSYLGSDIFLRSNDAVIVQLDYDDNENGNFRVRNGNQDVVFDVSESGNVDMGDVLQMGNVTIDRIVSDSMNFLRMNSSIIPNQDAEHILGAGTHRWINVWAVDGTINTSDRREKKNIENLNYGLNEVLQMQPVSFKWKNENIPDTKLGLIAQDLQKLVPEVVKAHTWEKDKISGVLTKKELERLGVYYSDLVPVLIKAIQEQQKMIEKRDNLLSNLLERVEVLESNNK